MNKLLLMNDFEKVTDELLALDISKPFEVIIDDIKVLLDKRDVIIAKVDALENDDVMNTDDLNRILQKNMQVETLFQEVMLSIQTNINGVIKEKSLSSKKKKAHRGYMNPGHQNDGYFIDKKK